MSDIRSMPESSGLAALVRKVIDGLWPDRFSPAEVTDDVSLGADGLGLDSIEIAELVLACEDASGIPLDEELFRQTPLTVGGVTDRLRYAASTR